MTIKEQIRHGAIQKVCNLHNGTLSHFANFTLSLPLCKSLNFTKKLYNERKEDFFAYMAASAYCVISQEVENQIVRHN